MHINIPTPIANDDSKVCITENKMNRVLIFFSRLQQATPPCIQREFRFSSFSSSSKQWPKRTAEGKELLKEIDYWRKN